MMNHFLETNRLYLREIDENDFDIMFEIDNDPNVMKYIGNGTLRSNKAQIEKIILKLQNWYLEKRKLAVWATIEKNTNSMIGWHLLKPLAESEFVEVGYRLRKKYWGLGYATEMSQALINYGFTVVGLKQIVGITHPENTASQRVLEKCGLKYVREDRYYDFNVSFFEINK